MTHLPQKLQDKIMPEPNTGCWLWTGYMVPHGYGYMKDGPSPRPAHRAVYEAIIGPIPKGLDLDHLCRVRCCVNPDHLEPVTRQVNLLRGDGPQVQRQRGRSRTHCFRGHERTVMTTYVRPNGVKCCRTCADMMRMRRFQELRIASHQ